jgi:hypothetical protein
MADNERAKEQAKAQYESIAEMVAALQCDYDRLEELRDERKDLAEAVSAAETELLEVQVNGELTLDDLEEAKETLADARKDLAEWDSEYGAELIQLQEDAGDCENQEQARERIQEDPLSVEVRSGWCSPGGEMEAEEFQILLCTGGPACRIRGELGQYSAPRRAWIEYQDWFTAWEEYHSCVDQDVLLAYCREFFFGE